MCPGVQKEEQQRKVQDKRSAAEERKELEVQRRQREVCVWLFLSSDSFLFLFVCVGRASSGQRESSRPERQIAGGAKVSLISHSRKKVDVVTQEEGERETHAGGDGQGGGSGRKHLVFG